jgi:hypothetical protein
MQAASDKSAQEEKALVLAERDRIARLSRIRQLGFGSLDGLLVPLGVISGVAGGTGSAKAVMGKPKGAYQRKERQRSQCLRIGSHSSRTTIPGEAVQRTYGGIVGSASTCQEARPCNNAASASKPERDLYLPRSSCGRRGALMYPGGHQNHETAKKNRSLTQAVERAGKGADGGI